MSRKLAENWPVCLVLVALVVSPIFTVQDSKKRSEAITDDAIARCIAAAPRVAYNVAFQYEAVKARTESGDTDVARRYEAVANAGIMTIAAPKGLEGDKSLVELEYRKKQDGHPAVSLTDDAIKAQKLGCEQAYGR